MINVSADLRQENGCGLCDEFFECCGPGKVY
nr:hypothetical protein PPFHPHBJ_00134 [Cydia pomonella granulovirus]WOZ44910.1 hypothetical protein HDNAPKKO_00136 [Cydia pomonella granulovirus]WOZ45046.1 hypothetical protein GGGKFHNK_00134 [Cydia pomonella granulovirus]WOZ45182.1 hypothetical protein BGFFOGFG_00134 [Cydia pomonella granulovirus]WOZ45702.1 hypothetical protein AAGMHLIN_00131 [Cydia pomonella granulovirus]